MQSFRRAREGSAAAQQRDAMPAAGPRPKRSASMPFHGAGAAKGRGGSRPRRPAGARVSATSSSASLWQSRLN